MKGRILAGKYRLVHELGRGGMGSVWRADHIELRSVVAVKLIDPALAQSREGRSRFLREARAAGALRSNHVVQVYDYGVDADVPYLVMEMLEGESLASRLERKSKLTLAEMQLVIRQVGRALAKAHAAGIVHRDLKPENIFICSEGDSELVKVLDFGIAKVESNIAVSVQTQTGLVLGTPYYMSPEQAEGRRALDSRSDLWSLGVITFECLLGKRPFDGENLAQLILAICAEEPPVPSAHGDVPPGFDEWFLKAVARRVEVRFANIQELVDTFATLDDRQVWAATLGVSSAEQVPERLSAPSDGFLKNGTGMIGSTPLAPAVQQPISDSANASAKAVTSLPLPEPVVDSPKALVSDEARPREPLADSIQARAALSETGPRRGQRGTPLGLIVGGAAVLFAIAAAVVWKSGRSDGAVTASDDVASSGVTHAPSTTAAAVLALASTPPAPSPGVPTPLAPAPTAVGSGKPNAATGSSQAPPREVVAVGIPKTQVTSPALTARPADKPAAVGLYCVVNAISGRLQRVSSGTAGSFPCYVNAISGQLKRKN